MDTSFPCSTKSKWCRHTSWTRLGKKFTGLPSQCPSCFPVIVVLTLFSWITRWKAGFCSKPRITTKKCKFPPKGMRSNHAFWRGFAVMLNQVWNVNHWTMFHPWECVLSENLVWYFNSRFKSETSSKTPHYQLMKPSESNGSCQIITVYSFIMLIVVSMFWLFCE